ncbi:hypothetical protein LUZ60_011435 [Juncus effusus]|nr:hypothetical protein LUZ60_011435 [Juncus effusus]
MAISSLYVAFIGLIAVVAGIILVLYGFYLLVRYLDRSNNSESGNAVISSSIASSAPTTSRYALDPNILASLPVFFFASSSFSSDEIRDCAVCLGEFTNGEKGILLPKCGHTFHEECIGSWFKLQSTCPTCRSSVGSKSPKLG